jgi:hypothetical protein
LNKIEIRIAGRTSPRAKATLAAMRIAFRLVTIARSFDIGHLRFFFRMATVKENWVYAHRRSAMLLPI